MIKNEMQKESQKVTIFTDGSSRGNPGPGGWGAVVIYPNSHDVLYVVELGGREDLTTNNRMEMKAVLEALKSLDFFYQDFKTILFILYTDSSYVLNGATKWMYGWKKNNWMTGGKVEVKNQDIWEEIMDTVKDKNIEWRLLPGHAGIAGNERCDVIATEFADNATVDLYKGLLSDYPVRNILDIVNHGVSQDKNGSTKSKNSSKKAYSYISVVDGNIATDKTWEDCEKRVKGKSGARFKKAYSKEDEERICLEFLN